jgi:hypothetical protein
MSNYFTQYSVFEYPQAENCTFLGYYAASSGNLLPTFLTLEDGTKRLSRNVGKKLPLVTV